GATGATGSTRPRTSKPATPGSGGTIVATRSPARTLASIDRSWKSMQPFALTRPARRPGWYASSMRPGVPGRGVRPRATIASPSKVSSASRAASAASASWSRPVTTPAPATNASRSRRVAGGPAVTSTSALDPSSARDNRRRATVRVLIGRGPERAWDAAASRTEKSWEHGRRSRRPRTAWRRRHGGHEDRPSEVALGRRLADERRGPARDHRLPADHHRAQFGDRRHREGDAQLPGGIETAGEDESQARAD